MKVLHALIALGLAATPAWAVYAPIPESAKGKALTASVAASIFHDSNIFGASTNEIDSMVYRVAPSLSLDRSLSQQTFFSAGYAVTWDHVADRPGKTDLFSHAGNVRLAHAFSPRTSIDISDSYQISRSPESLLAGVPLNTDQSFRSNQLDGRFVTSASERLGFTFKGRHMTFDYRNDVLAASLDREELLLGASADFRLNPTTKLLGEYRYQTIGYDNAGGLKDKDSHFLLAGVDYAAGRRLAFNGRAGVENRRRDGAPDEDAPYIELSGRYAYGEVSFLSAGYVLTFEETSNVALYTDTKVNRFFVNVQHAVTPTVVVSGLFNYEPSTLQGRAGASPDRDETTLRTGVAVTYLARRNWSLSATLDWDNIDSDDASRDYDRTRIGVHGRYQF